jgi:hypothetical protein
MADGDERTAPPADALASADVGAMTEEEVALIVAMQGGFEPRSEDPLVKALEARGFAHAGQTSGDAWTLTESGIAFRPA